MGNNNNNKHQINEAKNRTNNNRAKFGVISHESMKCLKLYEFGNVLIVFFKFFQRLVCSVFTKTF